ncbi:MAG: dockerin type I domain-containing protein [Candidatus Staskawiczbacteria bacterium]|jgi:hypothetical protein
MEKHLNKKRCAPFLIASIFALAFFVLPILNIEAASTSAKYAGTATDKGGGTATWTNPSRAAGSNTSDAATAALPSNGNTSTKLALTNFGFTSSDIPAGATINGISVAVDWGSSNNKTIDNLVQLTKDGSTLIGSNKAASGTHGHQVQTYGGAADTWSAGLAQTDIASNSNFGVILQYTKNGTGQPGEVVSVYDVTITVTYTLNNPLPTTTSISPTSKTAGDSGFTLTVNGTNFISSSVVNFAGSARATTYVSSTQVTAAILTSDLTTAGTFNITVTNPTPGGGTSNAQVLTVNPAISKFVIINPTDGTVDAPITVTVQAQRTDNSIDTSYQQDVTLVASGSATGAGLVDIINGVGTKNISDTVAETVNLSLSDTQGTGLNVSSTQDVVFSAGVVKQFSLNNPGDMYAKTRLGYTVTRKDQFGNLVTSGSSTVYLYTSSTSSSKKFYDAATSGNIITSIGITSGHSSANFWYYDETPGTYTITASDNSSAPDGATGIADGTDSVIVNPVAVKFVILPATNITVDAPAVITVQAQKPDNSVDTNYQNDVTLNTTGAATGGGLVNIINGVGTKNISDTVAETITLSLTDSQTTGLDVSSTQPVVFAGGATARFVLSHPVTLAAGSRAQYTVIRKDQYNNLTTAGATTVYFYSTSSGANKKFYDAATSGNIITSIIIADGQSAANFWYYDEAPGTYSITASDNPSAPGGINGITDGVDSLAVTAGPVAKFILNNPGDMTAATRLGYTVSRRDQFNNLVTSGDSVVYLYSNSPGPLAFYDASINGNVILSITIANGNSSANFWYYDETPGTYTITASDNSAAPGGINGITDGTDAVVVNAAPIVATRYVILNPGNGTVDAPVSVTIQAQDANGNVDATIQTGVTLNTSSGTGGGLVPIANGVGTMNIRDTAAETVNLSLTDSQTTNLNVSSTASIIFSTGAVAQFAINNPGDMSAGTRLGYTVTRKDQFGNLVTGGATTVYLYGLPSAITKKFYDSASSGSVITFVNITDGNSSAQFWYYDEKAETASVVVSDNSTAPDGPAGIADISDSVTVSAGPVAKFILNNPGDMTASTRLEYTVSRQDQFGNPVTAGVTLVYLYTSSTGANAKFYDSATGGLAVTSIPVDDGHSSANFWYYDETPGTWIITVSDSTPTPNGNAGVADDADSVTVSTIPIVATRFVILSPDASQIGVPASVVVQAEDANSNIDTTYQTGVTLNTSGTATGAGLVNIINGVGTIQINDATAEIVLLSLSDTQTTGLDVSSAAQINFSASPPVFIGGMSGGYAPPVGGVSFSGRAYPGANLSIAAVTATENVIKQGAASSSDGSFKITFTGLSVGARAFALLVQDKDGRIAQSKVYDLNLLNADSVLEVNNIIVSPTIGFPRPTITKGDFLAVVGYAAPSSKLLIEVDGQLIAADITAGTDGSYKYLYNTALLDIGSHTIRARQVTFDGVQSEFSPQKVFFTTNLLVPKTDFNNDGKIDISDWSIFLAHWLSTDPATRLLDDLNGDGKVDASDFSIFIRTLRIQ